MKRKEIITTILIAFAVSVIGGSISGLIVYRLTHETQETLYVGSISFENMPNKVSPGGYDPIKLTAWADPKGTYDIELRLYYEPDNCEILGGIREDLAPLPKNVWVPIFYPQENHSSATVLAILWSPDGRMIAADSVNVEIV